VLAKTNRFTPAASPACAVSTAAVQLIAFTSSSGASRNDAARLTIVSTPAAARRTATSSLTSPI
jgi:hypothetical protein